MFSATYFGHQGWLFSTHTSRLLVDSLLQPKFGHGGYEPSVYPPRVFNWSAFPPIDAFFLSHEHEDHFDLPSFNLLSRNIPLYVSALSSSALYRALGEMGFNVHRVRPGEVVTVGDIELHTIAPDHMTSSVNLDELDVLSHVIKDTGESGSFFSAVDVEPTDRILERAKAVCAKPGIVCHTNNYQDTSPVVPWISPNLRAGFDVTRMAAGFHAAICDKWGAPEISVLCGGGMSFTDVLEWLNRRVLPFDPASLFEGLSVSQPGSRFAALNPGQTVVMHEGKVTEVTKDTPFLQAAPKPWPDRSPGNTERPELPSARCGKTELSSQDAEELQRGLSELAQFLYDSRFFKTLYSLNVDELDGNKPTIVFMLRTGTRPADRFYLAYDPSSCSFEKVQPENPQAEYLAGFECWATDLLEVIRGTLSPLAFIPCSREWNAFPLTLSPNLNFMREYVVTCFSPLRRPQQTLRYYRSVISKLPPDAAVIRAAK